MASVIKLKRSSTAASVPSDNSLQAGELAINLADKKLFSARSNGQVITISGDQYNMTTGGNSTVGQVTLTVDNDALSNDTIDFVGTGSITVSGNSSQITIDSSADSYDLTAGGTATTGTIILGGDADTDTVTLSGGDNITVTNTSTTQISVSLDSAVDLGASGSLSIGNSTANAVIASSGNIDTDGTLTVAGDITAASDVDITGEVNAASAAIVGDATIGGDADITGEVNAASAAIVGDAAIGGDADITGEANTNTLRVRSTSGFEGNITVGNSTVNAVITTAGNIDTDGTITVAGDVTAASDVDVSGEVNAATLAVVGGATVGGNMTVTGDLTVQGTTTTVESTTVTYNDGMLSLGDNQADTATDTDNIDIGIYGVYGNTSAKNFHGIVRDQSANVYVVFNGISTEPGTTVTYNAANSTSTGDLGQLDAIIDGGTY